MAAPLVFCEPVLAFIKAFRLRGDMNALKQAALSRFSIPMLASAKKALWESCSDDGSTDHSHLRTIGTRVTLAITYYYVYNCSQYSVHVELLLD